MPGQEPISYTGASLQEKASGVVSKNLEYAKQPSIQKGHSEGVSKSVDAEVAKKQDMHPMTKKPLAKTQLED